MNMLKYIHTTHMCPLKKKKKKSKRKEKLYLRWVNFFLNLLLQWQWHSLGLKAHPHLLLKLTQLS